jgi:aminopeptidase N
MNLIKTLFKDIVRCTMMHLLIGVCFVAPSKLNAQQPDTEKLLRADVQKISEQERTRFERMNALGTMEGATVASGNFDVHHYRCEWEVDPSIIFLKGKITSAFTITSASNAITFDLLDSLIVDSVLYHGQAVSFTHGNGGLSIQFPATIAGNTRDSVTVYYHGVPEANQSGSYFQSQHSGVPVVWTLSQPYGASDWWPCKNGLNDKADSLDVYVTCPQQYLPTSNGLLISNTVTSSQRTVHFRHRYPIASYLVAIAVTNYQLHEDTIQANNKVYPLIGYFYPERVGAFEGMQNAFFKYIFRRMLSLFGEYPFAAEKYGHTEFSWPGGMEHQTNSFILDPGPNLMAHELAHQWFGDKVTCATWSDLWLNEGPATYYGSFLHLEQNFPNIYRSNLRNVNNSVTSQPGGSVYVADTLDVARLFSNRLTYNKGALVLHMLRGVIGDSSFFRGMRRYLDDPALSYGFARTADLLRNMEAESGRDLDTFFRKWIYGEGFPMYLLRWSQNRNQWVKINLYQSTSHPSVNFFEMPVRVVLRGDNKDSSFILDHTSSGQEFWIKPTFEVDTILVDPDYWILTNSRKSERTGSATEANKIAIYPNPSNGILRVSLANPTDESLSIQLFNAVGQLVYTDRIITPGRNEIINIPLSRFAKGTYLLKLTSELSIKQTTKILYR